MEQFISEERFDNHFKPVKNHIDNNASLDGTMFETYGAEMDFVIATHQRDPNLVWTIVDGDDGDMVIGNGLSYVNRIGYLITEVPFDGDGFVEVDIS